MDILIFVLIFSPILIIAFGLFFDENTLNYFYYQIKMKKLNKKLDSAKTSFNQNISALKNDDSKVAVDKAMHSYIDFIRVECEIDDLKKQYHK